LAAKESPSLVPSIGETHLTVNNFDDAVGSSRFQSGEWSADGYLSFSGIYKID